MRKPLLLLVLLGAFTVAFGQPGPPPPDPGEPVPIFGLELLLVGGAGFGVSRILSGSKRRKDQQDA